MEETARVDVLDDRLAGTNLDETILAGKAVAKELELVAAKGEVGEVAMARGIRRELLEVVRTRERPGRVKTGSGGILDLKMDAANVLSAGKGGSENQEQEAEETETETENAWHLLRGRFSRLAWKQMDEGRSAYIASAINVQVLELLLRYSRKAGFVQPFYIFLFVAAGLMDS